MKDSRATHAPRRRRAFVGLALVALVAGFTLGVAAPAGAVTTLGQASTDEHCFALNGGSFNVLQNSGGDANYIVPSIGFLTSWSVADLDRDISATVQFEVWRPDGSGDYTLVFISDPETFTEDGTIHTFPLSPLVPVLAGDKIGLLVTNSDAGCLQSVTTGTVDAFFSTPGLGDSLNTDMENGIQVSEWQVNVAANFLPVANPPFIPPVVTVPGGATGGGTGVTSLTPQIPLPETTPPIASPVPTPAPASAVAASPHFTG